jgi:hypothetical protein
MDIGEAGIVKDKKDGKVGHREITDVCGVR